jgi:tetratricopeptide (TPR) repeat protein
VIGRAGIGKTALICRVLKHVQAGRLPDECGDAPESKAIPDIGGIIYESCLGKSRLEPDQILNDLLRLHRSPEEAEQLKSDWQTRQLPPEARFESLLEVLPDGRIIVLLDNFEDLLDDDRRLGERNAGLLQMLTAVLALPDHDVQVILTSRVPVYDLALEHPERHSDVEMTHDLQTPHAADLLRSLDEDGRLGLRDASDAQLERACVTTLGNPRGLLAVFGALRADREATLEEVLDEAERALHAEQPADATSRAVDKVVDAVVGTAFARLDEPAQQVMQALAVYARPVTATAVDWLSETTDRDAQPVLRRLVNMQLVHSEPGGYGLHPLDRAHALRSLNPHPESNGDGALRPLQLRAADWFAQSRTPRETWHSIADLAPQLSEIELRITAADFDAAADIVLEIEHHVVLLWGHADRALELRTRLQGKVEDRTRRQFNSGCRAIALFHLARFREAITDWEAALQHAREQLDRKNEGIWLNWLGNAYALLGETRRAIDFYEQALGIARKTGDKSGQKNCIGNLGSCYLALGEPRRSIDFFMQALSISQEIEDRRSEGHSLGSLGSAYWPLGETQKTIDFNEQALEIARDIGDRRSEGHSLGSLGSAHWVRRRRRSTSTNRHSKSHETSETDAGRETASATLALRTRLRVRRRRRSSSMSGDSTSPMRSKASIFSRNRARRWPGYGWIRGRLLQRSNWPARRLPLMFRSPTRKPGWSRGQCCCTPARRVPHRKPTPGTRIRPALPSRSNVRTRPLRH